MERKDIKDLVFSKEAAAAIKDLRERLRNFSRLIGRSEEPEVWAEVQTDGSLKVKIKSKTAQGQATVDLDIPSGHWKYTQ